jgi:hypothetical protein
MPMRPDNEAAVLAGVHLHCLKINQDGSPQHPLYIAHSVVPRPWAPVERIAA